MCVCLYKAGEKSIRHSRTIYGCFFVFAFVLPLSLIIILYGLMVHRLLNGAPSGGGRRSSITGGTTITKRRVTRLVVVVVATFAVCWLPLQSVLVVQYVAGYSDHGTWFVVTKIVASCLAYGNSCINPLLYAFLSDAFRKNFARVLCSVLPGRRGQTEAVAAAAAAVPETNKRHQAVHLQPLKNVAAQSVRQSRDLMTPITSGAQFFDA